MKHLLRNLTLGVVTMLLVLGGLTFTATATPAAHAAYGPTIQIQETYTSFLGGYVPFTGYGFYAGTTVRVEVLTKALSQVLGTVYVTADINGFISGTLYPNQKPCWESYNDVAYLAADGQPGPTAWAQTGVDFSADCPVWRVL
jgi:hypothetical protein